MAKYFRMSQINSYKVFPFLQLYSSCSNSKFFFAIKFFYIYNFIYLFLAALSLCCCSGFSFIAVAEEWELLSSCETVNHRLRLEPMCWDLNPAKIHGTWLQNLRKLRFLMSHHRSERWSDRWEVDLIWYRETHIPTDKSVGPSQRARAAVKCWG